MVVEDHSKRSLLLYEGIVVDKLIWVVDRSPNKLFEVRDEGGK